MNEVAVRVPDIREHLHGLGEAVGRAAVEDDLGSAGVGHVRVEMVSGEFAEEGKQWRVSFCCSVLEGGHDIDSSLEIGRLALLGDGETARRRMIWIRAGKCARDIAVVCWAEAMGPSDLGFKGVVWEV